MKKYNDLTLLEALFAYVSNALIYVNLEGVIIKVNERACELLHINASNAIGKYLFDEFKDTQLMEIIKSERIDENVEFTINSRKCITSRLPIYENKQLVGAVAVFDDITKFEQLSHDWMSNKTENSFLNTILELTYDGLIVVDKDGKITKVSNAYKNFLGLENKDLIGIHITEVIENTRMHIVAQTGIPEINDIQKLKDDYMVATRFPYYENGQLAGAIGKVLFRNSSEVEEIIKKFKVVEQELDSYKKELISTHMTKYNLDTIITKNSKMNQLKDNVRKIGQSRSNITILGESGTGKELFAHSIHVNSKRALQPFVKVNCAAIPDNLLESELFGYEKGAFTGANTLKRGKFEVADGGTLFLDEIGDMPIQMQAKILRILQEGEVERIGSNKPKNIDVRVIAATNRNLKEMIKNKEFREDLYYRINVINITVPPLRERKEDIILISNHLVDELNRSAHKNVKGISNRALNLLLSYEWPGNIRELKNVIERAYFILEGDSCIEPWHLPGNIMKNNTDTTNLPLKSIMNEFEKKVIMERLIAMKGNKTKASVDLGISRMALHKKLDKYGLK